MDLDLDFDLDMDLNLELELDLELVMYLDMDFEQDPDLDLILELDLDFGLEPNPDREFYHCANFEKCEKCEHFQIAIKIELLDAFESKVRTNADNFFVRSCPEKDFLFIDFFRNLKIEKQQKYFFTGQGRTKKLSAFVRTLLSIACSNSIFIAL